jgi:hypothetical protein
MAKPIIKGIVIMVSKLATAVKETDSAKSPLAKWVNRLDVGPPGQAANNITPMAVIGDRSRPIAIKYPRIGRMIIWLVSPIIMAFGYKTTFLKSDRVRDRPIPNIIIIKEMAKMIPKVEFIWVF